MIAQSLEVDGMHSLKSKPELLIFPLLFILLGAGCGGSGPHMFVPDPELGAAEGAPGVVGDGGSYTFGFFEEIQPIFEQRCSLCHPGATPDDWTVYAEARGKAERVAARVADGSMPPGNATQMTDEEREMVLIWVEEGAPRGEEMNGSAEGAR